MEIISAIATLVLVGITGWYAYITNKILKSSEKSLQEQLRPYLIVHLASIDHFLKINIKNIGKRPATNVDIIFIPDLKAIDRLVANSNEIANHEPILKQSYIPPEFEINTTLMYTPNFVNNPDLPRIFEVTIKYKDNSGHTYTDNYKLDLSTYIYDKKTVEFTDNFYFSEINKELKGIKEEIIKLTRRN